jgi:hypothetical protein
MNKKRVQLLPYWQALAISRAKGHSGSSMCVWGVPKSSWIDMYNNGVDVVASEFAGYYLGSCNRRLWTHFIPDCLISKYETK